MAEFFILSLIGPSLIEIGPFSFDVVEIPSGLISCFAQVGTMAQSIGPARMPLTRLTKHAPERVSFSRRWINLISSATCRRQQRPPRIEGNHEQESDIVRLAVFAIPPSFSFKNV
ncbi:hypothetical protein, partial [Mesorhizobium sp.]|uniref:hypothetical protein n=1 Tax=Mesorhizobium sp. TaxID=1871066 RepID=UPI0025EBB836